MELGEVVDLSLLIASGHSTSKGQQQVTYFVLYLARCDMFLTVMVLVCCQNLILKTRAGIGILIIIEGLDQQNGVVG